MSQISTIMRVEINQRRQNSGLKPVNLVRNFYVSNFNIHARENKSVRQNLGIKLVNLVPNFFSPLAALLSSALELQNIEFSK